MTNPTTLVQSPMATKFVGDLQIGAFRKAYMGDPATLPEAVRAPVTNAHEAVKESLVLLAGVANDPTKNDVLKHEAGETLAGRLDAVLSKTQRTLEQGAASLAEEAKAKADDYFRPDPSKAAYDMKAIEWLQENFRTPEGQAKIRAASKTHSDLARVMVHAPSYLLDISEETRMSYYVNAVERFVPDAFAAFETSSTLRELAKKYDHVRSGVRTSFYNPAIAEQAKRRVNV
jgi:hypothetical protein